MENTSQPTSTATKSRAYAWDFVLEKKKHHESFVVHEASSVGCVRLIWLHGAVETGRRDEERVVSGTALDKGGLDTMDFTRNTDTPGEDRIDAVVVYSRS
jgi:hypothetical protein